MPYVRRVSVRRMKSPARVPPGAQAACVPGSPFFCVHSLQNAVLQQRVRQHLLQLRVLTLQRVESFLVAQLVSVDSGQPHCAFSDTILNFRLMLPM